MIPLCTSSAMPIDVVAAEKTIVWAKIPGIRYSRKAFGSG